MKLNLELFIEGTIQEHELSVSLVEASTGNVIESQQATLSVTGETSVEFDYEGTDPVYVYIEETSGGCLLTSTAEPIEPAEEVSYNFKDAAEKAYAGNQKEIAAGVFAFYNGDFYKDGVIDNSDLPELTNQMSTADFNENVTNSVFSQLPYQIN